MFKRALAIIAALVLTLGPGIASAGDAPTKDQVVAQVNKAVEFVPHGNGMLNLMELSVTDEHWSVRKQKAVVPE